MLLVKVLFVPPPPLCNFKSAFFMNLWLCLITGETDWLWSGETPTGPFFHAALCGTDTRLKEAKISAECLYLPVQNLPVPVCVGWEQEYRFSRKILQRLFIATADEQGEESGKTPFEVLWEPLVKSYRDTGPADILGTDRLKPVRKGRLEPNRGHGHFGRVVWSYCF